MDDLKLESMVAKFGISTPIFSKSEPKLSGHQINALVKKGFAVRDTRKKTYQFTDGIRSYLEEQAAKRAAKAAKELNAVKESHLARQRLQNILDLNTDREPHRGFAFGASKVRPAPDSDGNILDSENDD
jgi:hypothetical protein